MSRIARKCLHRIHQHAGQEAAFQLVLALIIVSRLDYCYAVLAGLPVLAIVPLQRVHNAAARPVFNLRSRVACIHSIPLVKHTNFVN